MQDMHIFHPDSDEYKANRIRKAFQRLSVNSGAIDPSKATEPKPVPKPPEKPKGGKIKKGGWGAKDDALKWIAVRMKDDNKLFKVVDQATGKNVITDFKTLQEAVAYIDYYVWEQNKDKPIPTPGPKPDPKPVPSGQVDNSGVLMIYPTKQGGQELYNDDVQYKNSVHGGDPRDTFYKQGYSATNSEMGGYFFIKASKKSDELSLKPLTGRHSGDNPKEGRCYVVGIEFDGTPHFAKEYPKHPDTPNFSDRVKEIVESIGPILNKWIGIKSINYLGDDGNMYFECWYDGPYTENEFDPNNLPNKWKLFYVAMDDGKNLEGEVYTENQGNKFGDSAQFYVRIDTVTQKTKYAGISAREIVPPKEPFGGRV